MFDRCPLAPKYAATKIKKALYSKDKGLSHFRKSWINLLRFVLYSLEWIGKSLRPCTLCLAGS